MERLTHKRENGTKRGYWSPNKKQELVDRLAMYEDREESDSFGKWIPCNERLPRRFQGCLITVKKEDPYTGTEYKAILEYLVGHDGEHWNDADGEEIPFEAIAWTPLPEAYREEQ